MVRWEESYFRPFGVKSPEATREKHYGRIKKAKDIPYNEIIHPYFEENIISKMLGQSGGPGSLWFGSVFTQEVRERGAITKRTLKELEGAVNWRTREEIQASLVRNGYPKSWDTAFYMAHYNKINALMKRITKELVKHYV